MSEEMETREGQINIMLHGAEKFGLNLKSPEIDDRNYKLHFLPYRTERRFSEFDGVITFQGLFERFERSSDNYLYSRTIHSYDRDELDKRDKETRNLIDNGGFIAFLLHAPFKDAILQNNQWAHYIDTDLVKRLLDHERLYREDLDERLTNLRCVRDEFLRFFKLYGAFWTNFSHGEDFDLSWRNLALRGDKPVSMVIADRLFFVPCLLPDRRKEEFYRLLADAVVTCVKKLQVELPAWADEFLLPNEQILIEEQARLSSRLEVIDKERSILTKFKRVLIGDSDALVDDVVYLLTAGLGYKVRSDDNYREDIQILNAKGEALVFGEVKGTTRGVKRDFINQADSHRERAGHSSEFPVVVILNTHTKNVRTVQEKDQEVPSEQVRHAVNMNVLIIRTLDLLNLLVLAQKRQLSPDDILGILQKEVGWLRASEGGYQVHRE